MNKNTWYGIVLVAFTLTFLGCSKPGEPEKTDSSGGELKLTQPKEPEEKPALECPPGVVALVDDREITREDAENRARMTLTSKGFVEGTDEYDAQLAKARKGAVDLLIETYVLQAAADDTIEVTTQEVEQELLVIKSRHPNRESYEEGLKRSNLTEEEFKEILERDIQIRKVLGREAQEGVPIPTKEDARKFYEVNSMAFGWPYRVRYDEIIWPLPPDVTDASSEQAKTAMEELAVTLQNSPERFNQEMVKNATTTWGFIGIRHPYETVDRLDQGTKEALETLVLDEISNPIETPSGYSIIRIIGTRESYESAEQEILQSIYDDAVAQNLQDWKERQRKKHAVRICDLDYYEGKIESEAETK